MTTGQCILNMRISDDVVIAWCSCQKWHLDADTRDEARTAHRAHFAAANEAEQAARENPCGHVGCYSNVCGVEITDEVLREEAEQAEWERAE